MSNVEKILARVNAGAKLRILMDHYGQERVQLEAKWLPIRRSFELTREELRELKRALWKRGQQQT